jgi:Flp pilus assembly protein TadG
MTTFIHKSTSKTNRPASGERGQSLIEFTFMSMILMVLLMGILDLGRVYFTFLALQDAAGEGANYGSVYPTRVSGTDANNITYRVRHSAPSGLSVDLQNAVVTVQTTGATPGSQITVTVTAEYKIVTPFVGALVGGQTIPLSARSVAVITTENQ